MQCSETFETIYRHTPTGVSFCPYRICPIGAHIDHQRGKITGFAINKGIHIAYAPKQNGVVELCSLNFDKRAQFHINEVPVPQKDWADYLRGAVVAISGRYTLHTGLAGVIEGSLPIGGLSSSAAVIIAFLSALCAVNGITVSPEEMIMLAQYAENEYVGVSVGKMDQNCAVHSRKGTLLYLDTGDDSFEQIQPHPDMLPYQIVIFFSGVERSLANSKYNLRVDELKSAGYAMKGYAADDGIAGGIHNLDGRYTQTRLRDVPREIFDRYQHKLPSTWRKRAEHYYTEFERVVSGVEAWRKGDIQAFGKLVFQSGWSSIHNYECGSDELKTLYDIMTHTDGIYGGRFSGAGFKGCCMALVDPAYAERVERQVTSEYLKAYPELSAKFSVHFCESADGVQP